MSGMVMIRLHSVGIHSKIFEVLEVMLILNDDSNF